MSGGFRILLAAERPSIVEPDVEDEEAAAVEERLSASSAAIAARVAASAIEAIR